MSEGFRATTAPEVKKSPEMSARGFLSMLRTGEVVQGLGYIPPSEEVMKNIEALLSSVGASISDENMENATAGLLLNLLTYGNLKSGSSEQISLKIVITEEVKALYA